MKLNFMTLGRDIKFRDFYTHFVIISFDYRMNSISIFFFFFQENKCVRTQSITIPISGNVEASARKMTTVIWMNFVCLMLTKNVTIFANV